MAGGSGSGCCCHVCQPMLRATLAAYSASDAIAVAPASQGSALRMLMGGGSGTAPWLLLLLLLGRGSTKSVRVAVC